MKIGDRVRYIGAARPDWHDIPATIVNISENNRFIEVRFDREWTSALFGAPTTGIRGHGIKSNQLEYLTVIDPHRPVQTTECEPRVCRTIGVLERTAGVKTLLIELPTPSLPNPTCEIEIDLNGRVVGSIGRALSFVNTPVVSSGFFPLDRTNSTTGARGLISLSLAKSEYPHNTYFVEIISTDNVPTEAKIHAR